MNSQKVSTIIERLGRIETNLQNEVRELSRDIISMESKSDKVSENLLAQGIATIVDAYACTVTAKELFRVLGNFE